MTSEPSGEHYRSLRIVRRNHCDDYLTAIGITCRVDRDGALRVWSRGGFRMASYASEDWISVENASAPRAAVTPTPDTTTAEVASSNGEHGRGGE